MFTASELNPNQCRLNADPVLRLLGNAEYPNGYTAETSSIYKGFTETLPNF